MEKRKFKALALGKSRLNVDDGVVYPVIEASPEDDSLQDPDGAAGDLNGPEAVDRDLGALVLVNDTITAQVHLW